MVLTDTGAVDFVIDRDSVIQLSVVAGKTYYLKATSGGSSTGAYFLALSPVQNDCRRSDRRRFSAIEPERPERTRARAGNSLE